MIGAPPHLWGTHLAHYVSVPRGKIRQIEQFAHCRPLSVPPPLVILYFFFVILYHKFTKRRKVLKIKRKVKRKSDTKMRYIFDTILREMYHDQKCITSGGGVTFYFSL
nr:MAG TPA_asm: hypothetical protein [Caudoviricetes sp.]